jgi:hypothetical protein
MLSDAIIELVALLLGELPATAVSDLSFAPPATARNIGSIPALTDAGIKQPTPRRGCAIGWRASNQLSWRPPPKIAIFLVDSNTMPLELQDLGDHVYGGPDWSPSVNLRPAAETYISIDRIGHLYTKYGGIIDLGHLRDHADYTRYIATQVVALFRNGGSFSLGDDTDPLRDNTGDRVITIKPQGRDPTAYQAAVLGAVISYQVAVWHEIATYKTMQDYSTFSPEDNYTNLLGAYVGFLACLNDRLPYDAAMSTAIARTLMKLGAVPRDITVRIVDYLEDKWYTYGRQVLEENFKPANKSVTFFPDIYLTVLRRHCGTGFNESRIDGTTPSFAVSPWLITDASRILTTEIRRAVIPNPPAFPRVSINIPVKDENGVDLRQYYTFEIRNAANKDDTLLENFRVNGTLDSSKFGHVAELVRGKYVYEFSFDTDSPRISA